MDPLIVAWLWLTSFWWHHWRNFPHHRQLERNHWQGMDFTMVMSVDIYKARGKKLFLCPNHNNNNIDWYNIHHRVCLQFNPLPFLNWTSSSSSRWHFLNMAMADHLLWWPTFCGCCDCTVSISLCHSLSLNARGYDNSDFFSSATASPSKCYLTVTCFYWWHHFVV